MQYHLFDAPKQRTSTIELADLFDAYYRCRNNKRNTINALAFEMDYENNLIQLCEEINNGTYAVGKSIAFIVNKPVKREIFAADFRDRIVHHWLSSKLNPLFENQFIFDSYACRVNKGTHVGVRRIDGFIKACSKNYSTDCYVLKLDVLGFFMHINRGVLFKRLEQFIREKYKPTDSDLVVEISQKIIFNDPTKKCILKGDKNNWNGLPKNKSLFYSPPNCGLPIGNLTSQLFANFYMDRFDHFIKHELGIRYYGRYVDDFVIIHAEREYLKSLLPLVSHFLQSTLQLTLHPRKIYLQHYSKGVQFLGAVIKPNRIYIAARTKGNFYAAIQKQNGIVKRKKPTLKNQRTFLSSMNSYLGTMAHYQTHTLRKKMIFKHLSGWWWNHVCLSGGVAELLNLC